MATARKRNPLFHIAQLPKSKMTKLLIVNEDPKDRKVLEDLVRNGAKDLAVSTFANGTEALVHARDSGADCVLLGHRPDQKNGAKVIALFRELIPTCPVIVVTDTDRDQALVDPNGDRATEYLPKQMLSGPTLRRAIDVAISRATPGRSSLPRIAKPVRILLIDDSPEDRENLEEMIFDSEWHVDLTSVESGSEAIQKFDRDLIDCILLDYRLEVEDGLDILARFKAIAPHCPVIMLTGQGSEEIAVASIKVGAADYLVKQRITKTSLRVAIANAMSRASLEAKVASQEFERQQFLRTLVHDLRAPLNNLGLLGDMAIEGFERGNSEETKELIATQAAVARRALSLVSTLETYSLLDGEVAFAPTDLSQVATDAHANLASYVSQRRGKVVIGKMPRIFGHSPQLIQLFQNLIQNGLKYNKSKMPRVALRTEVISDRAVVVVVEDNGIGIPDEALEQIFSPLKRLWSQNEYEGTGLGLAICRRIVERHGGAIWCTSSPSEGSQFHIRFPSMV